MYDLPTLTAAGVTLRAATPSDEPWLLRLASEPDHEGTDDGDRWVIEAPAYASGRPVGRLSLRDLEDGVCRLQAFVVPQARNLGVATTATGLVVDWVLGSGRAQTLTCRTRAGNTAAWRVAWKNGFAFESTSRRSLRYAGALHDSWHAAIVTGDTREPKTRWLSPVPLEGPGVVLRGLTAADEAGFLETVNDPVSHHWLAGVAMPRTPEEFRRMQQRSLLPSSLGTSVHWVLAHPETDAYLGSIHLFGMGSRDHRSAEVGYRTHPAARGRGVLRTALRAVIGHAFAPADEGGLGLERLSLGAGDGNAASQAVARSCGFVQTGRDRRSYELADGSVVDLVRFDLLASEPADSGAG